MLLDGVHVVAVPVGTASGEMTAVGLLALMGTCGAARGERYARTGAAIVMHVNPSAFLILVGLSGALSRLYGTSVLRSRRLK